MMGDAPPPADAPGRFRFLQVRRAHRLAIGLVALAILGVGLGSWVYLNGLPPRLLEILDTGTLRLEVPFRTLYTLPEFGDNASTWSETGLNEFDSIVVGWSARSESLPVQVSLHRRANESATYRFTELEPGTWIFRLAGGSEVLGTSLPSVSEVLTHFWDVQFTVRLMARYDGFFEARWIDVLLLPTVTGVNACFVPCANVTLPGPDDLVATGVVDTVDLTGTWVYDRSIEDFDRPDGPFRNVGPDVVIDSATSGRITLHLETEFQWGSAALHRVSTAGEGPVSFTVTWYWDRRFGSLYSVVD